MYNSAHRHLYDDWESKPKAEQGATEKIDQFILQKNLSPASGGDIILGLGS
jgi:hypothetical protein